MEEPDQWSMFDRIVCITVDPESTRVRALRQNLARVRMHRMELFVVARSTQVENVGPDESIVNLSTICKHIDTVGPFALDLMGHHLRIARQMYDSGAQNIIVLEDDACFDLVTTARQLPDITDWLSSHDWDIFNFGAIGFPYPFFVPVGKHVAIVKEPLLAHSYALSRAGMKKLLRFHEKTPTPHHIDKFFTLAFPRYHAANPPCCFQTTRPALFRQALLLVPARMRHLLKKQTFKQFCVSYYYTTQISTACIIILATSLIFVLLKRTTRRLVTYARGF